MKIHLNLIITAALAADASAALVNFESLPLANADDGSTAYSGGGRYWNGSNSSGGFSENGATFLNSYNTLYDSWDGFAYSNTTDVTTGSYLNYSALPGSGADGSSNYALGYFSQFGPAAPPTIQFSGARSLLGASVDITNATYAGIDMRVGSGYSKKFGGPSGNDPDWFKVTIQGHLGLTAGTSVEFYLADFRFADNSLDYIVDTWKNLDLSPLGTVDKLTFSMDSSDKAFGFLNTPSYFALDNLDTGLPVPEPSSVSFCLLVGLPTLLRRRR